MSSMVSYRIHYLAPSCTPDAAHPGKCVLRYESAYKDVSAPHDEAARETARGSQFNWVEACPHGLTRAEKRKAFPVRIERINGTPATASGNAQSQVGVPVPLYFHPHHHQSHHRRHRLPPEVLENLVPVR